jgi:hypothetical protein
MDGWERHRCPLAAEEKLSPKQVAADAWAARDADRQQGVAHLDRADVKLREWCWAEAHDFRSAMEAAPEWRQDESLEPPRATERQARRPPGAREWAAVEVLKGSARMGAPQRARMRPVGRLARLDELVLAN